MLSSPAWLTIALNTLASDQDVDPTLLLDDGIRVLPKPHVLHHLNRWARHVWRPAVTPRALAALTRQPTADTLTDLGSGALSLLAGLVEAIRRCDAGKWVDVLGVMFLANDPWVVEVGRVGDSKDIDRAAAALRLLYERKAGLLAEVASQSTRDVGSHLGNDIDMDSSTHGESFAELRCRIAALQLQLDDVTSVVRRNEKNTKDLLSSFHFWSMLLLDELRSYKSQVSGRSTGNSGRGTEGSGGREADGMFDSIARHLGHAESADGCETSDRAPVKKTSESGLTNVVKPGVGSPRADAPRAKRIFRDGKWIVL